MIRKIHPLFIGCGVSLALHLCVWLWILPPESSKGTAGKATAGLARAKEKGSMAISLVGKSQELASKLVATPPMSRSGKTRPSAGRTPVLEAGPGSDSAPLRFATAPDEIIGSANNKKAPETDRPDPNLKPVSEPRTPRAGSLASARQDAVPSIPKRPGETGSARGSKELVKEGVRAPRLRLAYDEKDLLALVQAGQAAFVLEKREGNEQFLYAYCRGSSGKFRLFPAELQADYENRGVEIRTIQFPEVADAAVAQFGYRPAALEFHLGRELAAQVYQCQLATLKEHGITEPAEQAKAYTRVELRWDGRKAGLEGALLDSETPGASSAKASPPGSDLNSLSVRSLSP
jgi:hypothetical protein